MQFQTCCHRAVVSRSEKGLPFYFSGIDHKVFEKIEDLPEYTHAKERAAAQAKVCFKSCTQSSCFSSLSDSKASERCHGGGSCRMLCSSVQPLICLPTNHLFATDGPCLGPYFLLQRGIRGAPCWSPPQRMGGRCLSEPLPLMRHQSAPSRPGPASAVQRCRGDFRGRRALRRGQDPRRGARPSARRPRGGPRGGHRLGAQAPLRERRLQSAPARRHRSESCCCCCCRRAQRTRRRIWRRR